MVLREFVRRELLSGDAAQSVLAWEHSGFHVHHSVRLEADDGSNRVAHPGTGWDLMLVRVDSLTGPRVFAGGTSEA